MKTAVIATTIHTPHVLPLLHRYGPDVHFFIALDQNTPEEAVNFCQYDAPNAHVLFIQDQQKWKCSELIGWKNIQRRNLATLEAVAWGADIFVSWDIDNIPLNQFYFDDFISKFRWHNSPHVHGQPIQLSESEKRFSGIKASSPIGWFDVGTLLQPNAPHRGFPYAKKAEPTYESAVDIKIGVAAGLCLGDPDIAAVTRIANSPIVHGVSEIAHSGVVTDPQNTWTVFNTQNTAFIRELAPAMFCPPGVGRYDDIYASLITQRVMREKNLHVHFGKPFVWQQRNQHDLVKDLRAEIDGMDNIVKLAGILDNMPTFAVDKHPVRQIYEYLDGVDWFPKRSVTAALAFMDDIEPLL